MSDRDMRDETSDGGDGPVSAAPVEPEGSVTPPIAPPAGQSSAETGPAPLPDQNVASSLRRQPVVHIDLEREAQVLELVREGRREAALKLLLEMYGGRLSGVIARFERDRDLVRDVYQDVFLQAFRGIGQFRGDNDSSIWTWLCSIAVNRCRDVYRKRSRFSMVPLDTPGVWDLLVASSDSVTDTSHVVMHKHLLHCFYELPERMRTRLLMRYFMGLSDVEIAEQVNAKHVAVQVSIWRMLRQLKDCMSGGEACDGQQ